MFFNLAAVTGGRNTNSQPSPSPKVGGNITATLKMTAQERKIKTEHYLKGIDIPINPLLPVIEEEREVQIRNSKEIIERILVLTYLGVFADSPTKGDKDEVINFLKTERLWEAVSEYEKTLFSKKKLTEKDTINISWKTECIYILL